MHVRTWSMNIRIDILLSVSCEGWGKTTMAGRTSALQPANSRCVTIIIISGLRRGTADWPSPLKITSCTCFASAFLAFLACRAKPECRSPDPSIPNNPLPLLCIYFSSLAEGQLTHPLATPRFHWLNHTSTYIVPHTSTLPRTSCSFSSVAASPPFSQHCINDFAFK